MINYSDNIDKKWYNIFKAIYIPISIFFHNDYVDELVKYNKEYSTFVYVDRNYNSKVKHYEQNINELNWNYRKNYSQYHDIIYGCKQISNSYVKETIEYSVELKKIKNDIYYFVIVFENTSGDNVITNVKLKKIQLEEMENLNISIYY